MKKVYYAYSEFLTDCRLLYKKVGSYAPQAIVCLARGGLVLGHFLGEALQLRSVYSINTIHYDKTKKLDTLDIFHIPDLSQIQRVLIVDDIIDSGETMDEVKKILSKRYPQCEQKVATLFYKPTALVAPDYSIKKADAWIDFFWEVDINESEVENEYSK